MISSGDAKKVLLLNNSTQRINKPTTKSWSWTINVTHHMRIQFDIDPKFQNRKFGYLSLSTFSIRTSKYQWLSLMSCCTFLVCSTIHLRKNSSKYFNHSGNMTLNLILYSNDNTLNLNFYRTQPKKLLKKCSSIS